MKKRFDDPPAWTRHGSHVLDEDGWAITSCNLDEDEAVLVAAAPQCAKAIEMIFSHAETNDTSTGTFYQIDSTIWAEVEAAMEALKR